MWSPYFLDAQPKTDRIFRMANYKLRVNGRTTSVDSWDPDQPLLYVLRNAMGLHGPKFGCGLGQCGACTVLIDGKATRSCLTPVKQAEGRAITTIEGLGTPEKPDVVQAAFIAEQAAQCGYCTNGMVMTAKALLTQTPHPTVEQVKQGLGRNLCRCATYTRIVNAVLRAAKV
jgi:nicotinate dehydrogenase subunit A